MAFAAIGAGGSPWQDRGNGVAVMTFTLTGKDFYPSTPAYGRLTSTSGGLLPGSVINVADLGKSPQDGFTEYLGYPGPTSPRWRRLTAGRSTTADASTSPVSTSRTGTARDRRFHP